MLKPALTLSLALAATAAFAGPAEVTKTDTKEKSVFDSLWEYPTLYKNKDASFLNEFRIVGRAHFDYYNENGNNGLGSDQDFVVRRLRLGVKASFFHSKLDLHVETDLAPQNLGSTLYVGDPTYQRLTDAYVAWKFSDALKLTVGKQSVKFTLDGGTSSNELLTIDRNNLSNNLWFPTEYITGVSVSGKKGGWQYNTGIFSGGDIYAAQSSFAGSSKEFGDFNGGNFWLGSVGYDFAQTLGVKKALLRADCVYNDPNVNSNATRNFSNIGSLNFQLDAGRWGFSTDVAFGNGSLGQSDVFGFVAMPWFNLTEKLQVVGRYTYMSSDDPDGLRFNRYESTLAVNTNSNGSVKTNSSGAVSTQKGDEYNEVYLGLNWFIYGHKLKLQTGWNYAWMHDSAKNGGKFDGWGWTTGLRVSW
jgi:phosphate-selective porin OprO/OprP